MTAIDPRMRADAAVRDILHGLGLTLAANIAGTREDLDSEYLHDLRVAVRRTRSALSLLGDLFEPGPVADFRNRFAWLQQVTGPARDLDVWLAGFAAHRDGLPPALRPRLEPLRIGLRRRRLDERRRLAEVLDSAPFAALIGDWRAFLEAPLSPEGAGPASRQPVRDLADARIWRQARRARRAARVIDARTPPADLHELRKRCKKLRYLMEFFRDLHPAAMGSRIARLKTLLDRLGAFQDLTVQVELLTGDLSEFCPEAGTDPRIALAVGVLAGQLLERRRQTHLALLPELAIRFDGREHRASRAPRAPVDRD